MRVLITPNQKTMRSGKKKTIWYLEDDELFAYLIEHKFAKELDFKVSWFSDKISIMKKFDAGQRPDVLVLDDKIRSSTSEEIIVKVKEAGIKVPIISLTSNKSIGRAVTLMSTGIDGYVRKSADCYDQLIKEIKRVIKY